MPKKRKDTDPLGLQGSGFDTLRKIADPETYRSLNNIGKRAPEKKASPQLSKNQIAASALKLGYTSNRDGTFKKTPAKKAALGGHRGK